MLDILVPLSQALVIYFIGVYISALILAGVHGWFGTPYEEDFIALFSILWPLFAGGIILYIPFSPFHFIYLALRWTIPGIYRLTNWRFMVKSGYKYNKVEKRWENERCRVSR